MKPDLAALERREFDLIVVGGGIFGACAALDAAQRGLDVALLERGDFCSETSAQSFKLIHGGIRYLQHADLVRLRQSATARRALLRIAPHLTRALPVVVPTYGHGMRGKEVLQLGVGAYDLLTWDRNRGVCNPRGRVPRGQSLGRDEVLARYPGLRRDGLTGAAVLWDGQIYNPPRLVLAFVRTAAELGAQVANYVEVRGLLQKDSRVVGVEACEVPDGAAFRIRGRAVLNAAGPWAEGLLGKAGLPVRPATPWSRDAYILVNRPLVAGDAALALPASTRDPGALVSRGERHLFLVPWHGGTLAGVWHRVYRGDPDRHSVEPGEIVDFVGEINGAYSGLDLEVADVSLWNAGLIPFGENEGTTGDLRFAHRSRLLDHAHEHGVEGLVSLIGVRFTTGPVEAATAVDLLARKLGRHAAGTRLDRLPLHGGDFPDFEALVREIGRDPLLHGQPEPVIRALAHNHGAVFGDVAALIRERPELARRLPDAPVLEAEIVHAARSEMARTLADVVLRRTDLGTLRYPGRPALERCAELLAIELGWSAERRAQEVDATIGRFPRARP